MTFLIKVFPQLGFTPETYTAECNTIIAQRCRSAEFVDDVCKGYIPLIKRHWLKTFVENVLELRIDWPRLRRPLEKPILDTQHDVHRISKADLEKIYDQAARVPQNELFFLTLLTTGMRIGGYAKMRCDQVADLDERGLWVAREMGTIVEKGNKLFSFHMHARVRHLLELWLNNERPSTGSPFVFPGQREHMVEHSFRIRFAQMCRDAGLQGRQFHPHALRHCYSHILLELGNSVDVVSRLINHTNSATTQKYYLKESAADVAKRAIIPWMDVKKNASQDPVPNFLRTVVEDKKKQQREDDICVAQKKLCLLSKWNAAFPLH
jgi:integrase